MADNNLVWHEHKISRTERCEQKKQKSCLLWFTGLSGAGKSTLANAVEQKLFERGIHSYLLDGDNVRHGLNGDLGFSDIERVENIRRIGEVSKLFVDAGLIVLSAFISPFRSDRNLVRALFGEGDFIEIYVAASIDICESRDPKGLYKKARQGFIKNFTGIDSPYEVPETAEIVVDTGAMPLEECVDRVMDYLEANGKLS